MSCYENKTNLLKALAIMLVVSGHLEFSLIPLFPPYSFQVVLFFFISGMLYKEKYTLWNFTCRRFKSLMVPYILYAAAYLGITLLLAPVVGRFWGMPITFENEFIMPFYTGHQLALISPLWFVPQLFVSLFIYKITPKKMWVFVFLAFYAIYLAKYKECLYAILLLRTFFSLLFIHLGYLYKTKIEGKVDIFNSKIFFAVIIIQALLWLTNKDFNPEDGIGLSYILVWGKFSNKIVPILTSLTGIWAALFIIEVCYNHVKNWKFLHLIGQNTYHIMANHLFVFNVITYSILAIKGISFDVKNNVDIYWFYAPLKTRYFYFVVGIFITTYFGVFLKKIKELIKKNLKTSSG